VFCYGYISINTGYVLIILLSNGQLSLAIPPWVGAMSTSESWDVNRHTVQHNSPVSVVSRCKLVSVWKLRQRRSAPPYGDVAREGLYVFLLYVALYLSLLVGRSRKPISSVGDKCCRSEEGARGRHSLVVSSASGVLDSGVWVVADNYLGQDTCFIDVRTYRGLSLSRGVQSKKVK